jgi:DNA-binding PadR family transcriptional regulator
MSRLRERAFGTRPLGPGTLYPLLRRLERARLVRCWVEEGRSRVGRPRHFQELTASGIAALGRVRQQLQAYGGAVEATRPRPSAVRKMRTNLRRSFRVSSFAMQLRNAELR